MPMSPPQMQWRGFKVKQRCMSDTLANVYAGTRTPSVENLNPVDFMQYSLSDSLFVDTCVAQWLMAICKGFF